MVSWDKMDINSGGGEVLPATGHCYFYRTFSWSFDSQVFERFRCSKQSDALVIGLRNIRMCGMTAQCCYGQEAACKWQIGISRKHMNLLHQSRGILKLLLWLKLVKIVCWNCYV